VIALVRLRLRDPWQESKAFVSERPKITGLDGEGILACKRDVQRLRGRWCGDVPQVDAEGMLDVRPIEAGLAERRGVWAGVGWRLPLHPCVGSQAGCPLCGREAEEGRVRDEADRSAPPRRVVGLLDDHE